MRVSKCTCASTRLSIPVLPMLSHSARSSAHTAARPAAAVVSCCCHCCWPACLACCRAAKARCRRSAPRSARHHRPSREHVSRRRSRDSSWGVQEGLSHNELCAEVAGRPLVVPRRAAGVVIPRVAAVRHLAAGGTERGAAADGIATGANDDVTVTPAAVMPGPLTQLPYRAKRGHRRPC